MHNIVHLYKDAIQPLKVCSRRWTDCERVWHWQPVHQGPGHAYYHDWYADWSAVVDLRLLQDGHGHWRPDQEITLCVLRLQYNISIVQQCEHYIRFTVVVDRTTPVHITA